MNLHELTSEFEKVYFTKIEPKLRSLEEERIKVKNNVILLLIIVVLLIGLACLLYSVKLNELLIILDIIFISFILFVISCKIKNFIEKLKSQILIEILKVFGDFYIFKKELITSKDIEKTGLFPQFSSKKDDDNICGVYGGKSICIVETRLTHEEGSGKHRVTVTDFRGLIIKVVLNKKYQGKTLLYQQWTNNSCESGMANFIKNVSKLNNFTQRRVSKTMEKVILEDPKFNDMYEVFSDNQIEARYIITTAFMERLTNIRSVLDALNVHCYFEDNYMTLFMENNKNFFEVGEIYKTLFDKSKYEETFNQLVSIFELIKYFKLDQKLGL